MEEELRDRVLMDRAAEGDRSALEELYHHYYEPVYRSALMACRSVDDAVDATQEAFLTVFKKVLSPSAEIDSFRGYLFVSVRHASLKLIAKRGKAVALPVDEMPEPLEQTKLDVEIDPERTALIEDQQTIVRKAAKDLPPKQLQALSLYEINGTSYLEIGKVLDMEANAVAQLIMRARLRLRQAVREHAAQEPKSKVCADALALLPKKAEGNLSRKEAEWLEPHLASCKICQSNLAVIEEVGVSYRALIPSALIFERIFSDQALAQLGIAGSAGAAGSGAVAGGGGALSGGKVTALFGHKVVAALASHPLVAAGVVTGVAAVSVAGVKISKDAQSESDAAVPVRVVNISQSVTTQYRESSKSLQKERRKAEAKKKSEPKASDSGSTGSTVPAESSPAPASSSPAPASNGSSSGSGGSSGSSSSDSGSSGPVVVLP